MTANPPPPGSEPGRPSRFAPTRALVVVAVAAAGITLAVAALLVNIFERKQEARSTFVRAVALDDTTQDPARWGEDFPQEYDGYRRTVDMVRTRFGGSEAMPRVPTPQDPRDTVSTSRLDADPRLRTMWAGYAFARDFREERGHAYMLEDQMYTERQRVAQQPGSCLQCHASVYVPYRRAGNGDLVRGFRLLNAMRYQDARRLVQYPVSCIDCHEPGTMRLRITRPGFILGIRAYRASQGVPDYDVNRDASRQEMRSYVCGQCHVEYYLQGPDKQLVYPWFNGLTVEQILAYYDSVGQNDWVHALTGAGVLKAQHPEFEMWNQGIHARSGVACADCHMPYVRVGAAKISDHQVRSPLLNVNRACQTCHRFSEEELRSRAEAIQATVFRLRNAAMDALTGLISDLEAARRAGRGEADLATARSLQRRAQFFLDFVEAENSTGFHAPQEAGRILAEAANYARQGQIALRDRSFRPSVPR